MLHWPQVAGAADIACGVGQSVQGEFGGGAPGTIAEIGSAAPHVGWYRIVSGWNAPNGDWYNPAQWEIRSASGADRCRVQSGAQAGSAPAANPRRPATAPAASATEREQQLSSTDRCTAGKRVRDRKNRLGEIRGENNGMCLFVGNDGTRDWLLPWMLSAVDSGAESTEGLPTGSYTCTTNGAGIFRIEIQADGDYVDRAGKSGEYLLKPDSTLEFASGSLRGYYGRLLPGGRFGLGARADSMLATVCDRKS